MYLQITQGRPQIHNAQSFRREVMKVWHQQYDLKNFGVTSLDIVFQNFLILISIDVSMKYIRLHIRCF